MLFLSALLSACTAPGRQGETVRPGGQADSPADTPLRKKIAQMLLVGFRGTELAPDSHIYGDVSELGVGGVLLFDYDMPSRSRPRNITSKEQLTRLCGDLQNIAPVTLFIAVDQEGGRVNRLREEYGFPPTISAEDMAADSSGGRTKAQAEETARILSETGINLNFAPCVDLNINPANPVIGAYGRSFSANPETVVTHAGIWINAHRRYGVLSCIKHFPGHGSSSGDTHLGSVDVTGTWQEAELIPYQRIIRSGGETLVMTSHVFNAALDPRNPATLSYAVLTELLRNKLGFTGIIVSDDLDMAAIKAVYTFEETLEKAINAGVDLLCLSNNGGSYDPRLAQRAADTIYRLVEEGRIPQERIEASWQRIMAVKREL
jgi:beta-N-acetylhexosaminidase